VSDLTLTEIWPFSSPLKEHYGYQFLYFFGEEMVYFPQENEIYAPKNKTLSFRTYMNAFPIKKWKDHTNVKDFFIRCNYKGGGGNLLIFGETKQKRILLDTFQLPESDEEISVTHKISDIYNKDILMLSCEILCREDSYIKNVSYFTSENKLRSLNTGIVITTYNRQADLINAIESILPAIRDSQSKLFIINNGNEITIPFESDKIHIIDNLNLGGSGGFARGLYELIHEKNQFTHALFMDDDAYSHPSSLKKSMTFLEYCADDNASIAGAMLYSGTPYLQYELGATNTLYGIKSINQNHDMGYFENTIKNELSDSPIFGPWWYFIFPIKKHIVPPFPFFVRGDDVAFSLQNDFNIITLSSVSAWQPSFEYKISAPTEYLANRSFLMLPILDEGKHWDCKKVIAGFSQHIRREIDGYRYPIAEAMLAALEDIMIGNSFWSDERNTLARLARLKQMEKQNSEISQLHRASPTDHNQIGRKCGRVWYKLQLTLPLFARLKFRTPGISYNMWPQPIEAAARKGMIYVSQADGYEIACRFNSKWANDLLKREKILRGLYEKKFSEMRTYYKNNFHSLQSWETWNTKFLQGDK
jgi:glycosyltransferase involved in cell wall biosynthesis